MDYFITDYKTGNASAVALEDSIMQKNRPVTAGSKILENFISPIDATVVTRLQNGNFPIAGKLKMDEFGIPPVFADLPDELSSAVRIVADNKAAFSLCNDLFGKYRRQAPEFGCCYIHPGYGTVSRFGLIPLASSMDQIGVVCKNLRDGFELLSVIAGNDVNDGAMFPDKAYVYKRADKKPGVCVPGAALSRASERSRESLKSFASGFNPVSAELPYFDLYKQLMCILSCAEISNNINRYDGVKFGYRAPGYKGINDMYVKTRTEGFGVETKLAAIMGAMVLSKDQYVPYYEKAMKIRRLIKDSLRFDEYDIIALPCEIEGGGYENLGLFALPALLGLPSVSFPYNGGGIQLIANVRNENLLLTAWEECVA